jgi:protein Tob/BTG
MICEIQTAVNFLVDLIRGLAHDEAVAFKASLANVLTSHYKDHWFPEKPCRGSAYRSIRVHQGRMDPLIESAGIDAGLALSFLILNCPRDLTIWIDPNEVSYRFGEDGSIGVFSTQVQQPATTPVVEPTSRMHDFYDTCRKQVQGILKTASSVSSEKTVNFNCVRNFVMV